ncbi:hypothetical protein CSAL01_08872 [Colletotrichum salicis]|uniref:Uncharacterized protein n=1 Tax=Colletotrichum salicis TaxID=1209931 RepID=A0A135TE82_9PEZI|nr:hypothetical protein CSAL01_08872 [Colletotrichum salicis]
MEDSWRRRNRLGRSCLQHSPFHLTQTHVQITPPSRSISFSGVISAIGQASQTVAIRPNNIKPVFGHLDVALNNDDSGDITVNISNTRRLGKPVIDHISDETFAFHGSRQQAHAMLDRILDHSENAITGIVSLRPDTSEVAPQSKTPTITKDVDLTATTTEPGMPTDESPATAAAATETQMPTGERPSTPAVAHQSQQTPTVAANPKPLVPQSSSLVLSRGHLKTAWIKWTAGGRRIVKLQTLLKKFPENNRPNPSVERMVLRSLAGKKPDLMVGDFEEVLRSFMNRVFKRYLQRNFTEIKDVWMYFQMLRLLWSYPDDFNGAYFPWAEMEPKPEAADQRSSAYATFKR